MPRGFDASRAVAAEMPPCAEPAIDVLLARVRRAIDSGRALEPVMIDVCRCLGFEQFVYTSAELPRPNRGSRTFVWTTMPWEWVIEYDRASYFAADPRVTDMAGRCGPLVWDAADYAGRDARVDAFLRAAARHGVCSGVVIPLADPGYMRLAVAFNSPTSPVDPARRHRIERGLDGLVRFAAGIHQLFAARAVEAPDPRGAPGRLSSREIQCLHLAARGLTSGDIAQKLRIAERTVHFHFGNIAGKLGVLNRAEAIAVAISNGLVRVRP